MQEKMTYIGTQYCYEEGHEVLNTMLGVNTNAMQVHRVTNTYGKALEEEKVFELEEFISDPLEVDSQETVYAMLDGSMVLTREEQWKEVKLGRMFKQQDYLTQSKAHNWIEHSLYEGYLGSCEVFCERMERLIGGYGKLGERLVFLGDGAKWIWNWVEQAYPEATQILDWYHAVEYLHEFCKTCLCKELAQSWLEAQKQLLEQGKVKQVILNIQSIQPTTKKQEQAKSKIESYYKENQSRMCYDQYKNKGIAMIGSGAIEAANRQVVQKRLKLSGQRWTKKGAQNTLNLRTLKLSGKWNKVIDMICQNKIAA